MKKLLFLAATLVMSVGAWAQTTTCLAKFDFSASVITESGATSVELTDGDVQVTVATSHAGGLGSGVSTYTLTNEQLSNLNSNVNSTDAFTNEVAKTFISAGAKNSAADLTITITGLDVETPYNISLVSGIDFEGQGSWNSLKSSNTFESCNPEMGTQAIQARALTPYVITSMVPNADGEIVLTIDCTNGSHTAVINALSIASVTTSDPIQGYSLHIGETGYSTLYLEENVKVPSDVEVYFCTSEGGSKIQATKLSEGEVMQGYLGFVVKGEKNSTVVFGYTNEDYSGELSPGDNVLFGVTENVNVSDLPEFHQNPYVLSEVGGQIGFYKFVGTTLKANRAYYLPVGGTEVQGFVLDFGGESTTGIESLIQKSENGISFDLQGRRVNANVKGISIQNGVKVIR